MNNEGKACLIGSFVGVLVMLLVAVFPLWASNSVLKIQVRQYECQIYNHLSPELCGELIK